LKVAFAILRSCSERWLKVTVSDKWQGITSALAQSEVLVGTADGR
jgi:hypothetical protein